MHLRSGMTEYPKFKEVGESVEGTFVSYDRGVPGTFGAENILKLQGDDGPIVVRATAYLDQILTPNLAIIADATKEGQRLRVTLKKFRPSKKGNPMKVFDVELVGGKADAAESLASGEDRDLPEPTGAISETAEEELPF